MARDYGKVLAAFWQNARVRKLSEDARSLLIYFFSGPHSNALGTYVLPHMYMVNDLQWPEQRVMTALQELSFKPYALWDRETFVLHLPGWWGHNSVDNPKVAIHVAKLLLALPDCSLKVRSLEALRWTGKYTTTIENTIAGWTYETSQSGLPLTVIAQPLLAIDPPRPALPAPTPPAKTKAKGTRIADDWYPDADMVAYATGRGFSQTDLDTEVTKFIRYFTGPDAKRPVMKDWARAWANWIDRAAEQRPRRNGNGNGHANGHAPGSDPPWKSRIQGWLERHFWLASWGPEPGQPHCKAPPELLTPIEG